LVFYLAHIGRGSKLDVRRAATEECGKKGVSLAPVFDNIGKRGSGSRTGTLNRQTETPRQGGKLLQKSHYAPRSVATGKDTFLEEKDFGKGKISGLPSQRHRSWQTPEIHLE